MLNVEMQTYTYIGSTIVQIYHTILADIVRHIKLDQRFFRCSDTLKCHCNEKILDPILNTTEQHFHTSLNGVFSFSISCFVLEILRFFETCKLGVSDVIYSRLIKPKCLEKETRL